MKKTHILILVIAVSIILLVISIWAIAYPYFSNRIDNSTRQSFIDETISFLSTDEEFINKYGLIVFARKGQGARHFDLTADPCPNDLLGVHSVIADKAQRGKRGGSKHTKP